MNSEIHYTKCNRLKLWLGGTSSFFLISLYSAIRNAGWYVVSVWNGWLYKLNKMNKPTHAQASTLEKSASNFFCVIWDLIKIGVEGSPFHWFVSWSFYHTEKEWKLMCRMYSTFWMYMVNYNPSIGKRVYLLVFSLLWNTYCKTYFSEKN